MSRRAPCWPGAWEAFAGPCIEGAECSATVESPVSRAAVTRRGLNVTRHQAVQGDGKQLAGP